MVADRGKGPKAQTKTLGDFWKIAEDTAEEHGQTMDRENWRVVVHTHVAETRKEAIEQARERAGWYQRDYFENTLGVEAPFPDLPKEKLVDKLTAEGVWAVGTPDDVIETIYRLDEQTGGFGGFLIQATEWGYQGAGATQLRAHRPLRHAQVQGTVDRRRGLAEVVLREP